MTIKFEFSLNNKKEEINSLPTGTWAIQHVVHMQSINSPSIHAHDFVTSRDVSIHSTVPYLRVISLYCDVVSSFHKYSMVAQFLLVCLHLFPNQASIKVDVQLMAFARHQMKTPLFARRVPSYKTFLNHYNYREDFERNYLSDRQQRRMLAVLPMMNFVLR